MCFMINYIKNDPIYEKILYTPQLDERLKILQGEKDLHHDLVFHKNYLEWELSQERRYLGEEHRLREEHGTVQECLKGRSYHPIFPMFSNIFGEKINSRVWSALRNGPRHLAREKHSHYIVATAWVGLYYPGGYFETHIFTDKDPILNHVYQRYFTLEEAKKGHEVAMSQIRQRDVYTQLRPSEMKLF